jgi:hypothetical protein
VTWNRYDSGAIDERGGPKLAPALNPHAIMRSEFEPDPRRKVDRWWSIP